jgi:hypothetical protein
VPRILAPVLRAARRILPWREWRGRVMRLSSMVHGIGTPPVREPGPDERGAGAVRALLRGGCDGAAAVQRCMARARRERRRV